MDDMVYFQMALKQGRWQIMLLLAVCYMNTFLFFVLGHRLIELAGLGGGGTKIVRCKQPRAMYVSKDSVHVVLGSSYKICNYLITIQLA